MVSGKPEVVTCAGNDVVVVVAGEDERRCVAVLDLTMVVVLVKRVDLVAGVLGDEG